MSEAGRPRPGAEFEPFLELFFDFRAVLLLLHSCWEHCKEDMVLVPRMQDGENIETAMLVCRSIEEISMCSISS